MKSLILETATRLLMGVLLLFSVFMLLRGHNLPGGGFIGGLLAASAFTLKALAFSPAEARSELRVDPIGLIAAGLILAAASGLAATFLGLPYLTGLWDQTPIPAIGKFSTPLVFDIGVYLVVVGVVLVVVFALAEIDEEERPR